MEVFIYDNLIIFINLIKLFKKREIILEISRADENEINLIINKRSKSNLKIVEEETKNNNKLYNNFLSKSWFNYRGGIIEYLLNVAVLFKIKHNKPKINK